jgi:hypothetical protein
MMPRPIDESPRRLREPYDVADDMRYPFFHESDDQWRTRIHADNRSAIMEQLDGIPLGDYDRRIIDWLAGWDVPTIAVVASLLRRCRWAGIYDAGSIRP